MSMQKVFQVGTKVAEILVQIVVVVVVYCIDWNRQLHVCNLLYKML